MPRLCVTVMRCFTSFLACALQRSFLQLADHIDSPTERAKAREAEFKRLEREDKRRNQEEGGEGDGEGGEREGEDEDEDGCVPKTATKACLRLRHV